MKKKNQTSKKNKNKKERNENNKNANNIKNDSNTTSWMETPLAICFIMGGGPAAAFQKCTRGKLRYVYMYICTYRKTKYRPHTTYTQH